MFYTQSTTFQTLIDVMSWRHNREPLFVVFLMSSLRLFRNGKSRATVTVVLHLAQAFLSSMYYRQTSIGLDILQRLSRLSIRRHYSSLAFLKPRSHSSDRISHKVLCGAESTIQSDSKAHQRDFSLLCSQLDTKNRSLERWYSSFCVCCCCETTVVPVVHLKCPSRSPAVWELGRVSAVNP